jgi:hypothetical protein
MNVFSSFKIAEMKENVYRSKFCFLSNLQMKVLRTRNGKDNSKTNKRRIVIVFAKHTRDLGVFQRT